MRSVKITAVVAALGLATLAGCGQGGAAASNDPSVVTQEEIDLLATKFGPQMDPMIENVTTQLRTLFRAQTAGIPAEPRARFNASLDDSIEKMGPTIREEMLRGMASHVTLAEIKDEKAPDPARIATMQTEMRERGERLGMKLSAEAVLKACDDTGAAVADMCARFREQMTPEVKAALAEK